MILCVKLCVILYVYMEGGALVRLMKVCVRAHVSVCACVGARARGGSIGTGQVMYI